MYTKFLLFLFFLSGVTASAQNNIDSVLFDRMNMIGRYEGEALFLDDSTQIVLPPVSVLIENARTSAQVLFYQTQKEADDRELKSIRRKWLDYIKLNASYQYGVTNSYLMYAQSGIIVPPSDRYTNQAQSYYLLGAGISLPLTEIFDRRNRIKKQKTITREKDYQAQMWHDDQAIKIVECYTMAMENIVMIKPLLEDYTISSAQYAVSEIDFIKGKLTIQELNKQKTIVAKSRADMERNKMSLLKNILKLEILSNTKIISMNDNF